MKKIMSLIIVLILISGCNEKQDLNSNQSNNSNNNESIKQDVNVSSHKILTCTLIEKDELEKTTKYIFDFDNKGTALNSVTLSLNWQGNLKEYNVTKTGIEKRYIDKDFIHDKYEIKNINENEIEFTAIRKIKSSDKTILGDLIIEHNETYNSVLKEMTNHDYKCK